MFLRPAHALRLPALQPDSHAIENKFQKYYRHKYLSSVRAAVLYGTIVFALFAVNDGYKEVVGERAHIALTLAIRFAAVAVGLICFWLLPRFDRIMSPLVATAIFIFGSAQLVFGVIEGDTLDPTYRCTSLPPPPPGSLHDSASRLALQI